MQLLEGYLKAVAKGLPAEQREDILRELSDDIRSEIDEKEGELRRPLNEAEQREILKRHGIPLSVGGALPARQPHFGDRKRIDRARAVSVLCEGAFGSTWGSRSSLSASFSRRWSSADRKLDLGLLSPTLCCNFSYS
jgi:hypothetical protein